MNLFNRGFSRSILGRGTGMIVDEFPFSTFPIVDTVDCILNICRDIKADKLIQEKELAELEAKVNSYVEYTNFHRDTMNRSYELEKKELELIQIVTSKIMLLLERIEGLEEDSVKMKVYIEQVNRYQKILEKMVDGAGKYFNEKVVEANRIDIPEFIRQTEIGKGKGRKKLFNMKEAEYE